MTSKVPKDSIRTGKNTSILKSDLLGLRNGSIVINDVSDTGVLIKCDCGKSEFVQSGQLFRRGVMRKMCNKKCPLILAHNAVGIKEETYFKLRNRIRSAERRCHSPNNSSYSNYGGRGISVYGPWRDLRLADSVKALYDELVKVHGDDVDRLLEEGYQIDRIDVDGNYEPGNIRLISGHHNQNNRRGNVKLNIGGRFFSASECAKKWEMTNKSIIRSRLNCGKDILDAVFTPDKKTEKDIQEKYFGLFMAIDGYKGDKVNLSDLNTIFNFLNEMPGNIGMTKISQPHVFSYSGENPKDCGVTGVVLLAESHSAIHTFVERDGFFAFDLFSCKSFNPADVIKIVNNVFKPEFFDIHLTIRGKDFPTQDGYDYLREGIKECKYNTSEPVNGTYPGTRVYIKNGLRIEDEVELPVYKPDVNS